MRNYLKILIFIFLLSIMLSSCFVFNSVKHVINQELTINSNKKQYFTIGKKNWILLNVEINKEGKQTMLLDTKAPGVLFRKAKPWIDTLPFLFETKGLFNPRVAGGEKIKREVVRIDTASCKLFSTKNWPISLISMDLVCSDIIGIVGGDFFSMEESKLEINFDDKYLSVIDSIPTNFTEIKSNFSLIKAGVDIYLTINGIEYLFGLDTGFNGSMFFNPKKNDGSEKYLKHKVSTYGAMALVAGGIINDTVHTKIADKIYFDDNHYVENLEVKLTNGRIQNLIGIDFIKHYNWLIDYGNEKVYIQKRKIKPEPESPLFYRDILGCTFTYKSDTITVNLLSVDGRAEKAGLLLGDEILSFNGVNILDIPMCERSSKAIKILKQKDKVVLKVKRNDKILDIEI
ncbi:MAG: hypothetical protein B6I24_03255 [Bacteroidetes bacterium 4572_128]|nr:MAG: hypothetical protein B6I24_03255 [Bacteroidetes bacterium 4572_128]